MCVECVNVVQSAQEVISGHEKMTKKIRKFDIFFMSDDVFGHSAVWRLSFKILRSNGIRGQSIRIRGARKRRLYGSLAR